MTDDLPFASSDLTQAVKIRINEEKGGPWAKKPSKVMEEFDTIIYKCGDKPAMHQKVLKPGQDATTTPWTTWTWKEYRAKVDSFGKSLVSIGFEVFDVVNIIGFNAPEWMFSNFGAMAAGGVAAGIYATNLSDACAYITNHSKAKVVVVEGTKQLAKYVEISSDIPTVKAIVMYGTEEVPADIKEKCSIPVYSFDAFLDLGKDVSDQELKDRQNTHSPSNVCSLIYTSGTTGNPKAVMITHDNVTWTAWDNYIHTIPDGVSNDDCVISFLPLSHIAAQILDIYTPLLTGVQVFFAQPDALKGSLGATLKEVRPTIFFAVPRVWEKIYEKMQAVAKTITGMKKTISGWAKSTSGKHWDAEQFGSKKSSPFFYFVAKKILGKVHVSLGLDRCRACFTGAAPIEDKILRYFASINLPIYELFGQSECTGPHTVNFEKNWKMGTCGKALPATESKIDEDTGELCYRGRHIFAGYMGMEEETNKTIDDEGWLHSGDVAKFDEHGFMRITGRIKELIITAGGENVPPVLIEEQFKLAMPALSNCMVIGDKRKFLSIILTLKVEVDAEGNPTDTLTGTALETSKSIGSTATTASEAKDCDKWKEYFDEGLKVANEKATSRAQRIAKWSLVPYDFSERGGELTPTLKLKRKKAEEKYSSTVEAMYA